MNVKCGGNIQLCWIVQIRWLKEQRINVRTTQDAERLAAYETGNYRAEDCLIRYIDGKEPSEDLGYTFKYVGDPRELTEGQFDLKVWLRRMGRHAAADKLEAAKCEE